MGHDEGQRFFTDLDAATYFGNDPLVQGTLAHMAAEMSLTKTQRIITMNPDALWPPFQGRSRMYVGPAIERVPTQADLDGMHEWKGVRADRVLTWLDETTTDEHWGDTLRDERAEEARRLAAEREQADRARKDEVAMRAMNRTDRRAYLREQRRTRGRA